MTTTENSDFTPERVSKLCRIRDVRADFQLSPTEYVAILSIIDEYARLPSFLPAGWLECEDVLFETLVRVYRSEQQVGESADSWISTRLRNDFMSGPDFTLDRFDQYCRTHRAIFRTSMSHSHVQNLLCRTRRVRRQDCLSCFQRLFADDYVGDQRCPASALQSRRAEDRPRRALVLR